MAKRVGAQAPVKVIGRIEASRSPRAAISRGMTLMPRLAATTRGTAFELETTAQLFKTEQARFARLVKKADLKLDRVIASAA